MEAMVAQSARALLDTPVAVAVDGRGNIAIADYGNHRVRMVAARSGTFYGRPMKAGDIYTIAGNGLYWFSGDGGPALRAEFGYPNVNSLLDVATNRHGDLLISDSGNGRLRLMPARDAVLFGRRLLAGHVYSLAGRKRLTFVFGSDYGCPGTESLAADGLAPCWVGYDGSGNAVVSSANEIKVVAAHSGTDYGRPMTAGHVYVIAGGGARTTDGALATEAKLAPFGLAIDGHGNILTASGGRIRVVAAAQGTFYGTAMKAGRVYSIGTGTSVEAIDHHGNAVITSGNMVRVIAARDGIFYGQPMTTGHVYTVAGNGDPNFSSDGGPATAAGMSPADVAVDPAGNLLISDGQFQNQYTDRLRVVAVHSGTFYGVAMTAEHIYTVAGAGMSLGEGVPALAAQFPGPVSIAVLPDGGVIAADAQSRRIRLIHN